MATPAAQNIVERPITFGEQVCGLSKKTFIFQKGELSVGELRISKAGKAYQVVYLIFQDPDGVWCKVKRIFYEGQVYHAEKELKPYHGQTLRFGLFEINPKKVEEDIGLDGGRVYTYTAQQLFLDRRPEPRVALILTDPEPGWDNDLPEDLFDQLGI